MGLGRKPVSDVLYFGQFDRIHAAHGVEQEYAWASREFGHGNPSLDEFTLLEQMRSQGAGQRRARGKERNWAPPGGLMEVSPGQFQFTDPQAANTPQRFYRVRSP